MLIRILLVDISTTLALIDVGLKLSQHLGVIEGATTKLDQVALQIDKLAESELKAGLDFLAASQLSRREQIVLLQDARRCFTKAVHVETRPGKVVACFGLAICYNLLGDQPNGMSALAKITELDLNQRSESVLDRLIPDSVKIDAPSQHLKNLQKEVCRYLCKKDFPHKLVPLIG